MEKTSHMGLGKMPRANLKPQGAHLNVEKRHTSFDQRKRPLEYGAVSPLCAGGRSRNASSVHERANHLTLDRRNVAHRQVLTPVLTREPRPESAASQTFQTNQTFHTLPLAPFAKAPYSDRKEQLVSLLLNGGEARKSKSLQGLSEIARVDTVANIVSRESTKTCVSTMKKWHARRRTFVNGVWNNLTDEFKDLLARLAWFAISNDTFYCRCYLCDNTVMIPTQDEDNTIDMDCALKLLWAMHGSSCHYIYRLLGLVLYKKLHTVMFIDDTTSISSADSGMSSESADEMDSVLDSEEGMNAEESCCNVGSYCSEVAGDSGVVRSPSNDSFFCEDFGRELEGASAREDAGEDQPLAPSICNFCSKFVKVTAFPCGHMFSCPDHIERYLFESRKQNHGEARCTYCRAVIEHHCISRSAGFYDEEEVKQYHRKSLLAIERSTKGASDTLSKM